MGTKEKLIERFKCMPKDFTWQEVERLFSIFGYVIGNKGKTSGSRIIFRKGESVFMMHKPHRGNIINSGVMNSIYVFLKNNKLI